MTKNDLSRRLEVKISPSSLRVYALLLKNGPMGVREIQRKIGFKSPSTVKYHLNKLVDAGLVVQRGDGLYQVSTREHHLFSLFQSIAGKLVPRILIAGGFMAGFTTSYIILYYPSIDPIVVLVGGLSTILMFIEGYRIYKVLKALLGK